MSQLTPPPAAVRVDRVREQLERAGAAAFVCLTPANQTWLAGFRALIYSRPIVLVVDREATTLIVPALEQRHAAAAAGVDRLRVYHEVAGGEGPDSPCRCSTSCSSPHRGAPLAIEASACPWELARHLDGLAGSLLPFDAQLTRMRAVKDAHELTAIRRSAEVVGTGVAAALAAAVVGATEVDVDAAGSRAVAAAVSAIDGASILEEAMMTPSGPERSTLPHVFSTTRRLQAGDGLIHTRQVGIDGYRAELERTVLLDPPSAEQRRVLAATERAQRAGLAAVAAGRSCASVDRAARAVFDEAGLGAHVVHRSGHGIGLLPHEPPYLRFDAEEPLEAGMVITIEPGVYVPRLGGFRHSDTVVVTDDGCELLTELPE